MFTGLIETIGTITRIERAGGGGRLHVDAPGLGREVAIGESIAVDGVCLTVVRFVGSAFTADVSEETLSRTTLGGLAAGSKVNLERALRLSDRLGGHLVTGHVDAVGALVARRSAGNSVVYEFSAPGAVEPFLAPKGSIAVNGISLTVASVTRGGFTVAIIPHTEAMTTLKGKPIGAGVNLEADPIARYVHGFLDAYRPTEGDAGGGARQDKGAAPAKRGLGDLLRDFSELG